METWVVWIKNSYKIKRECVKNTFSSGCRLRFRLVVCATSILDHMYSCLVSATAIYFCLRHQPQLEKNDGKHFRLGQPQRNPKIDILNLKLLTHYDAFYHITCFSCKTNWSIQVITHITRLHLFNHALTRTLGASIEICQQQLRKNVKVCL